MPQPVGESLARPVLADRHVAWPISTLGCKANVDSTVVYKNKQKWGRSFTPCYMWCRVPHLEGDTNYQVLCTCLRLRNDGFEEHQHMWMYRGDLRYKDKPEDDPREEYITIHGPSGYRNQLDEFRWLMIPFWSAERQLWQWAHPHRVYDYAGKKKMHLIGDWNNKREAGPQARTRLAFAENFLPPKVVDDADGHAWFEQAPAKESDHVVSGQREDEAVAQVMLLMKNLAHSGRLNANLQETVVAIARAKDLFTRTGLVFSGFNEEEGKEEEGGGGPGGGGDDVAAAAG